MTSPVIKYLLPHQPSVKVRQLQVTESQLASFFSAYGVIKEITTIDNFIYIDFDEWFNTESANHFRLLMISSDKMHVLNNMYHVTGEHLQHCELTINTDIASNDYEFRTHSTKYLRSELFSPEAYNTYSKETKNLMKTVIQ